jgi:hypothetical protein
MLFRLLGSIIMLVSLTACGIFATRPTRQMAYAESAFQAATFANAETLSPAQYQLARDTLLRARSEYRMKNFSAARTLAVRSRRIAEEAEVRAVRSEKNFDVLNTGSATGPGSPEGGPK